MTRLSQLAVVALLGATLSACQDDPDGATTPAKTQVKPGRLEVVVTPKPDNHIGPYFIHTLPATRTAWTDSSGKAALDSVPPGRYKVYAVASGTVAQALTMVRGNDSVPVDLEALAGFVGPLLTFMSPNKPLHRGDSMELSVRAWKWKAGDSALSLEAVFPRGLRAQAEIKDSSGATLRLGPLTSEDTAYFVLARFASGLTGVYRMRSRVDTLPPLKLTARWDGNAVVLSWNRFQGNGFRAYEVSPATDGFQFPVGLKVTEDPDDTVFRDENPAPLESLKFMVRAYNRDGLYTESRVTVMARTGIRNFQASPHSVYHPTQPWIYTSSPNLLRRYNYQTGKSDSVPLYSAMGFMDIGDNGFGMELYIPYGIGRVLIMNAATLDTVGSINGFSTVNSVASSGKGRLMISASTPYSLMVVDRKTLSVVSGARGGYHYRLRYLPDGVKALGLALDMLPTYAFLIEPGDVRPVAYEFPGARDITLDARNFQVSPDGMSLVSGTAGAARRLDSAFTSIGILPPDSAGYACFAFSPAGDMLYAGVKDQRRIRVFTFPGLEPHKVIPTRGLPQHLVLREGEVFSLSATQQYSNLHLLERFTP